MDNIIWILFIQNKRLEVSIALPELSHNRTICAHVHVTNTLHKFNMIIGWDLLREIGITLNFKEHSIRWDDIEIPMKLAAHLHHLDTVFQRLQDAVLKVNAKNLYLANPNLNT